MSHILRAAVSAALAIALAAEAAAALVKSADGTTVTDTTSGLTWLANANLLGNLPFHEASARIIELNSVNYLGYSDWRLPRTSYPDPTCSSTDHTNGYGCTGSELGHLFYISLGGKPDHSILTLNNGETSKFSGIVASYYWSETPSPIYAGPYSFNFGYGTQDASNSLQSNFYSWLVRGEPAGLPTPGSAVLALIATAMLGLRPPRRSAV